MGGFPVTQGNGQKMPETRDLCAELAASVAARKGQALPTQTLADMFCEWEAAVAAAASLRRRMVGKRVRPLSASGQAGRVTRVERGYALVKWDGGDKPEQCHPANLVLLP